MTPTEQKVLACVDRSRFADAVADAAAWAAHRMDAPLEFLHVIDRHPEIGSGEDHSGAIGVDAQQTLLATLSERDAEHSRAAREAGRLFLNRLRERAIAAGVASPDTRQRHGNLADTLAEQAPAVRLCVIGRRGESAELVPGALGRNVEHVARALPRPILAVTERFAAPRRVLFAFDGSAVTRRGVERVAESPLLRGLPIHLLMSGRARADGPKQLEWARALLADAGFEVDATFVPGDTERVIAHAVAAEGIELIVMGAYTHSPWRRLFVGSRTDGLLRSAQVPALLLR